MTDPTYRFLLPRTLTEKGRVSDAEMRDQLTRSFAELCDSYGVAVGDRVFDTARDLLKWWSEPHRKYHTTNHLYTCISALNAYRRALYDGRSSAKLDAAEMALWFHDAVYVVGAKPMENEAASARLAAGAMAALGLSVEKTNPVVQGILSTVYGEKLCRLDIPAEYHDVCELVRSCDLAGLGATPDVFDAESETVFAEFGIPSPPFGNDLGRVKKRALSEAKRALFLQRVLDTYPYHQWFHGLCYEQACKNVTRAMAHALGMMMSNGVVEFTQE